jgi:Pyruvate/2-oxoacid:ferredoxin oxidoreductase gamma subunit
LVKEKLDRNDAKLMRREIVIYNSTLQKEGKEKSPEGNRLVKEKVDKNDAKLMRREKM